MNISINSFRTKIDDINSYFLIAFLFTITVNMFITGGRAGQVMFFAMIIIVIFQYYRSNIKKALIVIGVLVPLVFAMAYSSSKIFENRVDAAMSNISNFEENQNSSVGLRLTYAINSINLIQESPLLGTGVGSFKELYPEVHKNNTPHLPIIANQPHNMYVLVLVELGIVGLLSMLYILYSQVKISLTNQKGSLQNILGFGFPILFAIVMLSEAYLFLHYTTWLFVFMSAILYKEYTYETN